MIGRAKSFVLFLTLLLVTLIIDNGSNALTPISENFNIPIGLFQWGFFINALLYLYYGVVNKKPTLHLTPIMIYMYTAAAWGSFLSGKMTVIPIIFYTAFCAYLFLDIEAPEFSEFCKEQLTKLLRKKSRIKRRVWRG